MGLDGSDLSPRQRAILDYIVATVKQRGFPPAVREIGEAVGLNSPSTVHAHLGTLEEKGYLKRDATKPRAVSIRWDEEGLVDERPEVRNIPIYGRIAAGPTSLAEQSHEGMLPLSKDMIGDGPHFALKVQGDSMIEAGILDGDLVVVRSSPDATDGQIVAAQVTGPTGEAEATVKRFKKDGNRVLLIPANSNMEPIEAPDDLRILGRVVAVMRTL